jgi:hypothetical protein
MPLKRERKAAMKRMANERNGSRRAVRALESDRTAREALILELYSVIALTLQKYGISRSEQRRLFERARRQQHVRRSSTELLDRIRPLGDLLASWSEEAPYIDSIGVPRVLKLRGEGATFESLAKRFLPSTPLPTVVALACRMSNVGVLSGGRIALYGDTMVNLSKNPDAVLAQSILHVRQILDTCLYNAHRDHDSDKPGRLERIVTQELSRLEFERFEGGARRQLHDLCERLDRLLKSAAGRAIRQKQPRGQAGIGLYIYYNESVKGGSSVRKGRQSWPM